MEVTECNGGGDGECNGRWDSGAADGGKVTEVMVNVTGDGECNGGDGE